MGEETKPAKPAKPEDVEVCVKVSTGTVDISVKQDQAEELSVRAPAGSEGHIELKQCKLEGCKKAINPRYQDFCSRKHQNAWNNEQKKSA